MSSDDPTDNELERDANVHLGPNHHRPKLGTESRAINPRDLMESGMGIMEAEMLRQAEQSEGGPYADHDGYVEGEYERPAPAPPPRRQFGDQGRGADAQRSPRRSQPQQTRPAGTVSPFRRPQAPPMGIESASPPFHVAEAWDRFVIAALPLAIQAGCDDPEAEAIASADRLLAERRRRFG